MDIFEAAKLGKLAEIEYLLRVGVDINAKNEDGYTALMIAEKKSLVASVNYNKSSTE